MITRRSASAKLVRELISHQRCFTAATIRSASSKPGRDRNEVRYNYVSNPFDSTPDPDQLAYRTVTAKDLLNRTTPPKRVKMLVRDFIDDCLYNPNYGYFSTQAVIFDPDSVAAASSSATSSSETKLARGGKIKLGKGREEERAEGFDFNTLRTSAAFEDEVARRYGEFENVGGGESSKGPGRQVWHTPTELFKPWYGRAIARFLIAEYRLNLYPYEDLVIYEIGAGNGTLMGDILDYIALVDPEVYERTRYRIIEISGRLQEMQRGRVAGSGGGDDSAEMKGKARRKGHASRVEILPGSIFDWERVIPEPCFFLALEVLDNFAHDVIRYTTLDHQPLQCLVSIDSSGDYTELFEPVTDPLISRYLSLRARLPTPHRSACLSPILAASPLLRKLKSNLPLSPNLTAPEFLPTKSLMLLDVLKEKFPAHRLLMSDFSELTDTVPGVNAPVVQTRYEGETVACTTYLVQPGFFDIFFPTDFNLLRDLYALVMSPTPTSALRRPPSSSSSSSSSGSGKSKGKGAGGGGGAIAENFFSRSSSHHPNGVKELRVMNHAEFLERFGEIEMTRCQDGSNPMVQFYENAKFIY